LTRAHLLCEVILPQTFTKSYPCDFSLYRQAVVEVPSPNCHQDGRAGPADGRNYFRGAGDQDVRVGEAVLRHGRAGA